MDDDGSGTIGYEEFLKMMTHKILNRDPKDEPWRCAGMCWPASETVGVLTPLTPEETMVAGCQFLHVFVGRSIIVYKFGTMFD